MRFFTTCSTATEPPNRRKTVKEDAEWLVVRGRSHCCQSYAANRGRHGAFRSRSVRLNATDDSATARERFRRRGAARQRCGAVSSVGRATYTILAQYLRTHAPEATPQRLNCRGPQQFSSTATTDDPLSRRRDANSMTENTNFRNSGSAFGHDVNYLVKRRVETAVPPLRRPPPRRCGRYHLHVAWRKGSAVKRSFCRRKPLSAG